MIRQDLFYRPHHIAPHQSRSAGLKVPFGLKDGRMWSPKQVLPGKACGCVCPACRAPLIAKAIESSRRQPHFAHFSQTNCRAGYETALHRMAKQLIAEHLTLRLPSWDGEKGMPNPPKLIDDGGGALYGSRVEFPSRTAALLEARVEQSQDDYTPDVTAIDESGELMIEVRVTHAVNELKRRRVQSEGRRMIEVDLSRLPPEEIYKEGRLAHWVLEEMSNRYWLSCPEATEAWRESHRELKVTLIARNQEIARVRQQKAEEGRRQEQAQAMAADKFADKQAARERFRTEERSRYQTHLDALPDLVSMERVQTLLSEFEERDGAEATALIARVEPEAVRRVLRGLGSNSWIYQAHPALWQAASYQRFIHERAPGLCFNARDVARWVLQTFGKDETLYALFMAQYSARDRARKAGIRKHRISHWAFSELENVQIPNFYKPVNEFLDRLVRIGRLEPVPEVLGEVRIR